MFFPSIAKLINAINSDQGEKLQEKTTPQNLLDSTPLLDGLQPPIRQTCWWHPPLMGHMPIHILLILLYVQGPSSMAGLRARGDL